MVVLFSPLEPVIRKALSIIEKDLILIGVGVPSPSGLPLASDIFNDESIPFGKTLDVRSFLLS